MTAKNSILLIINQSPGIDYNSLLNKIAPNYSNINSARAALSRATKDLIVFGFVVKQRNNFFATDKAGALINSEMKNKLLMRLNQTINSFIFAQPPRRSGGNCYQVIGRGPFSSKTREKSAAR